MEQRQSSRGGGSSFDLNASVPRGRREVEVRWYDGGKLVARTKRTLR